MLVHMARLLQHRGAESVCVPAETVILHDEGRYPLDKHASGKAAGKRKSYAVLESRIFSRCVTISDTSTVFARLGHDASRPSICRAGAVLFRYDHLDSGGAGGEEGGEGRKTTRRNYEIRRFAVIYSAGRW